MSEESSSSKLDNFSKEELIKLIKKYVILQKQLKAKNEELTNRLNESNNSQNFSPEKFSNKKLEEENLELKEHIQLLSKQIEELNRVSHEYDSFRIEIQPQLENARNEIELNKSMLDMLNSEIQMLNSEKLQLEKRLYITRRNTPPSIIIEEDEEDLEEEERNSNFHIQPCQVHRLNPIEEEDLQQQHNNDINFLKQSNELGPDGILILNKQVEDLTFYVDELKSELEAEREKNNEYLNEIKEYRKQIEDFEEQHEFSNNELRLENDRLQKECCDALLRVSEKEKEIADLICSAQQVNASTSDSILNETSCTHHLSNNVKPSNGNTIEQFLNVFLAEIIDKQNYDFDFKLIDQFGESEHVLKQINFLTSKLKQTENTTQTKMEQIIKDFKEEINLIENELTNKKNEFNAYKLQIDAKLKSLQCELDNEKEKTKDLKKFEKEASKNKMLDLEIADYDRSIKSLNVQLIARDKEANDLKAEINSQNEAIIKLKNDLDTAIKEKEQSDEKCTKMKQLLVKAKKEVSDAKAHEAEHLSNDVQLKAQLENSFLEIENQKLQMAQLTIERQRLQDKLKACNESNQITVQSLKTKLKQADDTYLECNENFISLKTEYENYKLKVQHAFKKQKEQNESNITTSQANDLQKYLAEIEHLNHTIIKLNKTLDEKTEKAQLLEKENEFIQDEYAKSLDRNTKLLSELKEKENEWKAKFQEIKQENSLKTDETLQTIKELQNEKDYQANSFKEKLKQLNIQNMQTISMLQAQLEESKEEIDKLNKKFSEIKNTSLESNTVSNYMNTNENTTANSSPTSSHSNKLFSSPSIKNDFTDSFQRHLGLHENANSNDSSKLSKTLEQLLNEPLPAQTINSLDSKAILGQIEQLKNELNKAKTQLEHLNELLNESELNNSRLTEQINVLKEEIRRLERNQEREKSISNMEYLKNVVYKFLTFSTREEKVQLLPVLSTMLKLTQEEQNEIMNVKGPTSTGENRWTTYLPKWTN